MITFDNPSFPIWKAGFDAGAESNRAAIAELVGALTWCESIMTQLEATGMVHLEPHVPKHVRMIDKVRAAITKHQQPTTTKEQ